MVSAAFTGPPWPQPVATILAFSSLHILLLQYGCSSTCVEKRGAAIADASLADPLDQVDVGGGGHAGTGQRDVSSGSRQQMGLVVVN